jgi:hypothetical protein
MTGSSPHVVLRWSILSFWQIEENRVGNVLLIIVNGLFTLSRQVSAWRQVRHCGDNIEAGVRQKMVRGAAGHDDGIPLARIAGRAGQQRAE